MMLSWLRKIQKVFKYDLNIQELRQYSTLENKAYVKCSGSNASISDLIRHTVVKL